MSVPVLRFDHVDKTYRSGRPEVKALIGVSLSLAKGEVISVSGPSGSGKSTLLLTAGGLQEPDSGSVMWNAENPYTMSADARARARGLSCGFVFQRFHLLPYLDVRENLRAAALQGAPAEDVESRVKELIDRFALVQRAGHRPAALSTGERQRVALARALMNRPKLLLADEPTGNLDDASARVVIDMLAEFASSGGAVLLATHDPRARTLQSRSMTMVAGTLTEAQ